MTSRGTANVLTRATAILAAGFFITSLFLSIIASHERKPATVIPASQNGAPSAPAPANQGGVLNQLQQGAPAAPGNAQGPTVPQSK
jgi:preprotein translocase subunit SecG